MGAYENPTYYGIAQDYTAFNKAMMGTFDRYMQMYMMQQKAKAPEKEDDPNAGYYKLLEKFEEVPELLNRQHVELFGLDGTVRDFLPRANDNDKRGIETQIVGLRGSYDNINNYFANKELFKELDVETQMILDGLGMGKTQVLNYADKKNPWGNMYFNHVDYGAISVLDIGKRLALAERDFSNENFGRQIVNGSVTKVTKQIERWQEINKQNALIDSPEREKLVKDYADRLKIGENWAGYWHNEMEDADKFVELTGDARKSWLQITKKYPGLMTDNKIDLSAFGFSMIDFTDADNKIIKNLRDIAIKNHIADELINQISPEYWTPAGTDATQAEIRMQNEMNIRASVNELATTYNNQVDPRLGPLDNSNSGASGFLNYIQKNKFLTINNEDYEITQKVMNDYLTGDEGLEKAKQVMIERISQQRFRVEYTELNNREKVIVDQLVNQSIANFKEAAETNQVFKISTGKSLDFRNFVNDLSNKIFNNNKFNEMLIAPSVPDEITLPIITN
jgi:hypothetical protein